MPSLTPSLVAFDVPIVNEHAADAIESFAVGLARMNEDDAGVVHAENKRTIFLLLDTKKSDRAQ